MENSIYSVNPADTARFFRKKHKERSESLAVLFEKAKDDAEKIIRMIINDYHPEKIWQWGSLLKQDKFSEISDIDIALEGLVSPKIYFELAGKADAMTSFSVDIVQMETIEPLHAESIRKNGRLVYNRNTQ